MSGEATGSAIQSLPLMQLARTTLIDAGMLDGSSAVLLDIPLHGNVGDSLIAAGEFALLDEMRIRLVHCGSGKDDLDQTLRRIPRGATVLMQGGGNFGDLWPAHVYRLNITERLAGRANVIWLPQSIFFENVSGPLIDRTREVMRRHSPTILLRDQQSMRWWNELFPGRALLCPDMGLLATISAKPKTEADVTLALLRRDKESKGERTIGEAVDWEDAPRLSRPRETVRLAARKLVSLPATASTRRHGPEKWAFRYLSHHRVVRGVRLLGTAETVETDRLHAAILSLLLGREVVAHDNFYGKVGAVLNTWSEFIDSAYLNMAE